MCWEVVYDDNDQEEWDMSELKNGVTLFKSEVEFRSNDLINKSHGGTCGVDCKSDTSNECVDSDSENNMDEYFEYEVQPCDSDSDFCLLDRPCRSTCWIRTGRSSIVDSKELRTKKIRI